MISRSYVTSVYNSLLPSIDVIVDGLKTLAVREVKRLRGTVLSLQSKSQLYMHLCCSLFLILHMPCVCLYIRVPVGPKGSHRLPLRKHHHPAGECPGAER